MQAENEIKYEGPVWYRDCVLLVLLDEESEDSQWSTNDESYYKQLLMANDYWRDQWRRTSEERPTMKDNEETILLWPIDEPWRRWTETM